MLFLLNDALLDLDLGKIEAPPLPVPLSKLPIEWVEEMGRDLFSRHPDAHRSMPDAAAKLSYLLAMRVPDLNAALFVCPTTGGHRDHIGVRYASVGLEIMSYLHSRQKAQKLQTIEVDHYVWSRTQSLKSAA